MISILIHAFGAACFGISLYFHLGLDQGHVPVHLANNVPYKAMIAYPGIWKFLTIWDIVLQLVYHSIALLNDFGGSSETNPKRQSALQKIRDALFVSWAFPVGLFVSATFWGLFALDRALVYPDAMDDFCPKWINHIVHTSPVALMMLDLLLVPKILPNRKCSMPANVGFTVVYLSWVNLVYVLYGNWAYPVLDVLDTVGRVIFFAGSFVSAVAFYLLGETLTKLRWGTCDASGASASAGKVKHGKAKNKSKRA